MKNVKYILYILFFVTGYLTAQYIYSKQLVFKPQLSRNTHIKKHAIISEQHKAGVHVTVFGNPTCEHCDEVFNNIVQNLHDSNISFDYSFFPTHNLDLWLTNLAEAIWEKSDSDDQSLSSRNTKLNFFNYLKKTKDKWIDITNIHDMTKILLAWPGGSNKLSSEKIQSFISNLDHYLTAKQYYSIIKKQLKIDVLPSITVSMTLPGNIPWKVLQRITSQMQEEYDNLYGKSIFV